ncbi:ABC transporter ATP-binding protein [Neokomagataea thailandica NBRC 106555]|uniref:AarF/ABC1/UbiB kinase family protein n=2 Tax=Neokomagataea TaxID=1223423 RepID=A0A4Y6V9T9_9PROT|nr:MULTISPECIES: AarF/UbiB family protein [Neokomagataea]QDH25135.1 AarF/ABC1/UbiB kinase family protein [Neokomagataea tanensis]GBR52054.1 ABC transporter ATP-binding protein [Neokomagataea thailandica NBRC 106555]
MARDLDDTGFLGGVQRFAKTSGAVGGIAARLAGHKLGLRGNREGHAEDLKAALGNLKGPLMKAAQLLSTIPGALPEEYANELAHLQANAPPMGWNFVRRRMRAELGASWERHFSAFSHEAVAAASLGQVHRARLADGREVACKLQYPDMPGAVETDLMQFKAALGVFRQIDGTIRQDEVYAELADRLREELDYKREASHLELYRNILETVPDVTVPSTVPELCTGRLLTMEWVRGRSMRTLLEGEMTQDERNSVARALFKGWYTPVYRYGVIHGDPHMGNFTVREDYGLNLLDFGAIRIFSPRFVEGVVQLFTALRTENEELAFQAYSKWGFQNISRETAQVLNEWARFFYRPLMTDRVCSMQESNDPAEAKEVLGRVYDGLKRTGGVKLPREFVLLDRSAIGLGSAFLKLGARLNWHEMFQELIEGFNVDDLAARQSEALKKAKVPAPLQ